MRHMLRAGARLPKVQERLDRLVKANVEWNPAWEECAAKLEAAGVSKVKSKQRNLRIMHRFNGDFTLVMAHLEKQKTRMTREDDNKKNTKAHEALCKALTADFPTVKSNRIARMCGKFNGDEAMVRGRLNRMQVSLFVLLSVDVTYQRDLQSLFLHYVSLRAFELFATVFFIQ
jgi:hypothetical protein